METSKSVTRRNFVGTAGVATVATLASGPLLAQTAKARRRYAIVGTGVRGVGVEIDADLVKKSNAAAKGAGLADRVRFEHRNAFDADLRNADVIFMWLFPELMRLLRPKILAEAKPGARIITATWDLGNWPVDSADDLAGAPTIRQWIVPARIEGEWEWEMQVRGRSFDFSALMEQRIQQAEGAIRHGLRRELLSNVLLRGDTLQFTLRMTLPGLGYVTKTYAGRVQGGRIEGTVSVQMNKPGEDEEIEEIRVPWRASRPSTSKYFAPTGTRMP